MVPRVSEKVVQTHIAALLRSVGAKVYVIGHPSPNDGRKFRGTGQTPGIPDLLAFLPPRVVAAVARPVLLFVEAKAKGGRLRPEQKEFRDLCWDAHVEHVVGDLDAVIAWLCVWNYVKASQFPHYRQPERAEGGDGVAESRRRGDGLGRRREPAAAPVRGTAAPIPSSEVG